ncbi:UvrD-helicase domain-containing protein [Lysinibacillus sp. NPDC093216]|uniref:UvrD-helicase domain-containing protein n=1 Tax=Lysinibacillus sp. NPDC093216 TaxID=3390576 RepID=UPI003CFCF61F
MANKVISKVIDCLNNNHHFVLEAGAGAGKTYTLMQTINYIQKEYISKLNREPNILCITFTNVAKNEIKERINSNKGIIINTLHEFLWDFIKQFQSELIKVVKEIIDFEKGKLKIKINKALNLIETPTKRTNVEKKRLELESDQKKLTKLENSNFNEIKYKGYSALYKGIISHNDIIKITLNFLENDYFMNLFFNQFTHIFIDEFQDIDRETLLKILEKSKEFKDNLLVIGLFGDRMQQIYSSENIEIDYASYNFEVIPKLDNYRSCKEIILANNALRNDGLEQEPKNSDVKLDKLQFILNLNPSDESLKGYLEEDFGLYKRLFLNHREIAEELGFPSLSSVFNEEYGFMTIDKLLKKEDPFIYLIAELVVEGLINYKYGSQAALLKNLSIKEFDMDYLEKLDTKLSKLLVTEPNLSELLTFLEQNKLIRKKKLNDILDYYKENDKWSFIEKLLNISVDEYEHFYYQVNKLTNLDTLQGVKGDEFPKVIINVRMEQSWTKYNFDKLFREGVNDSASVQNAFKLFYVACTRPREALIINYICNEKMESSEIQEALFKNILKMFGDKVETYLYDNVGMISYNIEQTI